MNFSRGKQVVIHNSTYTDWGGKSFNAPSSFSTWSVNKSEKVSKILGDVAAISSAVGKLDAVHFITHGLPSYFQLGADDVSMGNVELFARLYDTTKNIIIWACQVGGDITPGASLNPSSLGCSIAQITNSKVIVGKQNQSYGGAFGASPGANGNRTINPNFFWGEIYLCHPDGGHLVVFKDTTSGQAQINIEPYVFSRN